MSLQKLCGLAFAVVVVIMSMVQGAHARRTQIYAPRNDLYRNAFVIENSKRLQLGQLYYGSRELGEPRTSNTSMGRTVWYKYKAARTGRAVLALTSGRMSTSPLQVAVYTGSRLTNLVLIQSAQMTGVGNDTAIGVVFSTLKGVSYSIQVDKGHEDNGFHGDYQIGIQQFDSIGGLALFYDRPSFLLEENQNFLQFWVVNGFNQKINIDGKLSNLSPYVYIERINTAVDAGGIVKFTVSDNYYKDLAKPGTYKGIFAFAALDARLGLRLGEVATTVYLIRMDYDKKPSLLVRFENNGQGIRQSETYRSRVYVKNISEVAADSCGFIAGDNVYGLTYSEYNSRASKIVDRPFSIAPGQEFVFDVSAAGSSGATNVLYNFVELTCWNYYANVNNDSLAHMWGYQQRGLSADLLISTVAANKYKQIGIPNFGFQSVVVQMKNVGEYSGEFVVRFDDDEHLNRANVISFCVSDQLGTCIASPGSSSVNIDLAPGEDGYVTFRVERGSDEGSGFVYISAETWDIPERTAGYGGFEVVKK